MTAPSENKIPQVWQPLTPRGVAAFAYTSLGRLFVMQFVVALLAASAVVWVLKVAWVPTIRDAIHALPEQGQIAAGKLEWHGATPKLLGEGHFLAFVVDTNHSGAIRSPAHVQVEFGRDDVRIISLGGYYSKVDYADLEPVPFNRVELEAWWGAWRPPLLWIIFTGVMVWCIASWTALDLLYFIPCWIGAFFSNRQLTLKGTWTFIGGALLPGGFVMIAGILLYGFGWIDLIQLGAVMIAHVFVGWLYIFWGLILLPKIPAVANAEKNPFAGEGCKPEEQSKP